MFETFLNFKQVFMEPSTDVQLVLIALKTDVKELLLLFNVLIKPLLQL